MASLAPIAPLFPLGGPVPSNLIIGRDSETAQLVTQLREGVSTLVVGPRRTGKTTVCQEACRILAEVDRALVVEIDVPERENAGPTALLQLIIDACTGLRVEAGRGALKLLRPTIEQWFRDAGLPVDLTGVGTDQPPAGARQIIGLPLRIAQQQRRRVLVFFDELQRVADYQDGHAVLTDIRDIYSAAGGEAVVLVDGSNTRTFETLLGEPVNLGRLVSRYDLPTTIPAYRWEEPLTERFRAVGLELGDDQRNAILAFGDGRPYDTMAAARYTALAARQGSRAVTDFDVDVGLARARQHLDDDGAA